MTTLPFIYGTFQPHKVHLPRWIFRRVSPLQVNEGDPVTLSVFVNNYQVGSEIMIWFTGGGSLAATGNWEKSWHDVMTAELAKYGCSYRRLSGSSTPPQQGTISGIITIGSKYQGQTMLFTNVSRKNKRTNATNPDGTPGYREAQFLLVNQGAAGTPERNLNGTGQILGGNLIRVLDTSRTPTGTPKIALRLPDGQSTLFDGDSFRMRIETENIITGTKLKLYPAGDGRRALSPAFRPALRTGGEAAGCSVFLPKYDSDNPAGYYDGGEVTFTDNYDDSQPIEITFQLLANGPEEETRELFIISQLTAEGDASEFDSVRSRGDWASNITYRRGDWVTYLQDGGRYIYTDETQSAGTPPSDASKWRSYITTQTSSLNLSLTIKPLPRRYWELRATVSGAAITYAINAPKDAQGASVALTSFNPPTGFDAALSGAMGVEMDLVGGRLVALAGGEVTFTVPLAGAGKHTLRITDADTSPIVIADAVAFLTPPVVTPIPTKQFGLNCAGAEFGPGEIPGVLNKDYIYPGTAEMDYYDRKSIPIVRLPVKWERIQPDVFGPLGGVNNDIARLDAVIDYWESLGGTSIIDVHNYMGRKGLGKVAYDNASLPTEALSDLWVKLATRYANRNVWFDLMNEPSGDRQSAIRVADVMQSVLNAIRARTSATNFVLIEGQRYSSAQYWVSLGQAAAYERFYDPCDHYAFSPHNYVDADASGTVGTCVVGTTRLAPIADWAESRGRRVFVGEIAGGDYLKGDFANCQGILTQCYQFIRDRPAFIGVTVWGGGRFWRSDYAFRLDPSNYLTGEDTGCMKVLLPFV